MNTLREKKLAFTLAEVLIVVGILSLLAVIAIITLDPVNRFAEANNARRLSDIQAIKGGVHQYTIDHRGVIPPGLDNRERQIGTAQNGCMINTAQCSVVGDTDCVDLTAVLNPYLHSVPTDPDSGSSLLTRYTIRLGDNNEVVVRSCDFVEEKQ